MARRRGCMYRIGQTALVCAVAFVVFFYFYVVFPFWGIPFNGQRHTNPPITPPWALECWLWEDDSNTAAATNELLNGYAEHDIPVRTIMIDSPWSTRYNDFVVDEVRFPSPAEFFTGLQDRGYRVVLWMTCMVDSMSKDTAIPNSADWFEEAARNGYVVGNDYQVKWWKGRGGFIDYTNPEAMEWWHGMQQPLFDWGIDGWKLDGCDTFFTSWPFGIMPIAYQRTHRGWMTTRGYMDHYARCEYQHGLTQNPEFVTLIRSYDRWLAHPEGFAPIDAAPVTWVGDRRHAWKSGDPDSDKKMTLEERFSDDNLWGFEGALKDIMHSAKRGYCVVGDDVAGYHGNSAIPPRLYIRWAQFAAFTGLFLNGGHGERRLWLRTPEELEIIRKFSWLHTELVPYMYSHVVFCNGGGKPLMRPVRGKYHYLFGDDFLVAPIYRDSPNNKVTLPRGRWRYLFDDRDVVEGPCTFTREFPLDELSVYVRDGAVVPMNVSRDYTGFGDRDSQGFVTWLIYPWDANSFTVHHPDKSGTTTVRVAAQSDNDGLASVEIAFAGVKKPHILRVLSPTKPLWVSLDDKTLSEGSDWRYDADDQRIWIKTRGYAEGRYVIRL